MTTSELPECPVEAALTLFGEKWKFLIIRELLTGTKRFKDLRSSIDGISDRMLSLKVAALVEDGLVHKEVFSQIPPKVEYSLTALGWSLTGVFQSLYQWGAMYQNLVKEVGVPRGELPPRPPRIAKLHPKPADIKE